MKREKKVQINSYLAVAVSTGCIAGNAMSQTVVFYGMNSANDTNPNPSGLMGFYYTPSVTNYGTTYPAYHYVSSDSDFIIASTDFPGTFNQEVTFSCNDFSIAYAGLSGYGHGFSQYAGDGSFSNGAVAGVLKLR